MNMTRQKSINAHKQALKLELTECVMPSNVKIAEKSSSSIEEKDGTFVRHRWKYTQK